jgi:hypothetical protein
MMIIPFIVFILLFQVFLFWNSHRVLQASTSCIHDSEEVEEEGEEFDFTRADRGW